MAKSQGGECRLARRIRSVSSASTGEEEITGFLARYAAVGTAQGGGEETVHLHGASVARRTRVPRCVTSAVSMRSNASRCGSTRSLPQRRSISPISTKAPDAETLLRAALSAEPGMARSITASLGYAERFAQSAPDDRRSSTTSIRYATAPHGRYIKAQEVRRMSCQRARQIHKNRNSAGVKQQAATAKSC